MLIETSITTRLSPEETWARLVDWPAHSEWIPLTKVWVTHATGGVGERFVGRTGIGALAFDDPMEVTLFSPPAEGRTGRCEVIKQGKLVIGTAGFTVTGSPEGITKVTWFEDIEIWPRTVTRLLAPLLKPLGAAQFRSALRRATA